MQQTLLFAFVSSAALVAGAVVGMRWQPPVHLLAALLAFACGALTTALAYELFAESFSKQRQLRLLGHRLGHQTQSTLTQLVRILPRCRHWTTLPWLLTSRTGSHALATAASSAADPLIAKRQVLPGWSAELQSPGQRLSELTSYARSTRSIAQVCGVPSAEDG